MINIGLTPYQLNVLKNELNIVERDSKDRLKDILSSTPKSTLKPTVCFTFDDGYEQDYEAFQMFKNHGVVGSSFIVKEFYENGFIAKNENWTHLTLEQMEEMYGGGWEFGSHGYRHIDMGITRLSKDANVGDTKIYTDRAHRYRTNDGVNVALEYENNVEIVRVLDHDEDSDGRYLVLEEPLEKSWQEGSYLKITDDELYKEVVWSKDWVESLGFPCRTLVYPYNSHRHLTRKWASKHYLGARAIGHFRNGLFEEGYGKTENEGINLPYPLNTFALWSFDGDGINRGNNKVKDIFDEVVDKNGLAIVMLHSGINSYDLDGVKYMIEEAQIRDIDITTFSEALHRFGNAKEIGDWLSIRADNIAREGNISTYYEVIPAQYSK